MFEWSNPSESLKNAFKKLRVGGKKTKVWSVT